MIRHITLGTLLLIMAGALLAGLWLTNTASGARVTVVWISGLLPNFQVRYASGTLAGTLHLKALRFKTDKMRLEADQIELDWSPACLLLADLCLREAHITTLTISLPAASSVASDKQPKNPLTLPTLKLPLGIDIDNIALNSIEIIRGDKHTHFTDLSASASLHDNILEVKHLALGMQTWKATAIGTINTTGDWPINASLYFATPNSGTPSFTLKGTAAGSLRDTQLALLSGGPLIAQVNATVATLQPGLPFTATLTAAQMLLPPHAPPDKAAIITEIQLAAQGSILGDFTISGDGNIDTPWTTPVPATLQARGTWRGIEQGSVTIDEPNIAATIVSDYNWIGTQHFNARADVRKLNLAWIHAALPSMLAGTINIDGTIDQGTTRINLDIKRLAGTLRQQPFTSHGTLRWENSHWVFDQLVLTQDHNNQAVLNGQLGDTWQAHTTLSLGNITALQPLFAGTAQGQATISGAPGDPHFAFTLQANDVVLPPIPLPTTAPRQLRLPSTAWQLTGVATLRDVTLQDAHTLTPNFSIETQGSVGWQGPLVWDLSSTLTAFPLHELLPELGGRVRGTFTTRGQLGDTLTALSIDTTLNGMLDALPLNIHADIDYTPTRTRITALQLQHGDNQLTLSGLLDRKNITLHVDADAPALATSLRDFSGSTRIQADINGPRQAPDADINIDGQALHWQNIGIGALTARLHLDDGAKTHSTLQLQASDWRAGNKALAVQSMQSLQLSLEGTRADHLLAISSDLIAGNNPVSARLVVSGTLNDQTAAPEQATEQATEQAAANQQTRARWQGHLRTGDFTINHWQWAAVGEPALTFYQQTMRVDAHCWSDQTARACLTEPAILGRSGHLVGEAFHLPLTHLLTGFLPTDTLLGGRIGSTFTAGWENGELKQFSADLRNGEPLQLALFEDDETTRNIGRIEQLLARATLNSDGMFVSATLNSADSGQIDASLGLTPTAQQDDALSGHLRINDLRLGLLEAFTFQLRDIGGLVDAAFSLNGHFNSPLVSGNVDIRQAHFGLTRLPLSVVDINLNGQVDDGLLAFDGSFRTPESRQMAHIRGSIDPRQQPWHGEATLESNELVIAMLPQYQFTLAPKLKLALQPERLQLSGVVNVPSGRIKIKSLPIQSVSPSRDVVIVGEENRPEKSRFSLQQFTDIKLALGNDISFKAFGAEGLLVGDLRLRSTPQLPLLIDGELHVREGKYAALGQNLSLKQADIIFNGPADQPLIDALAVRDINDPVVREVGVRLTGSLRAPVTTLWSSPELPPQEVVSWLTTGRSISDGPLNLRGEATQAAFSMGLAQGNALLNQAGQHIGLEDVQISAISEGDESEVQVGTRLNKAVYVGYNRRVLTGEDSVLLRLQLSRRLILEALSGLESAVDIFYTFDF